MILLRLLLLWFPLRHRLLASFSRNLSDLVLGNIDGDTASGRFRSRTRFLLCCATRRGFGRDGFWFLLARRIVQKALFESKGRGRSLFLLVVLLGARHPHRRYRPSSQGLRRPSFPPPGPLLLLLLQECQLFQSPGDPIEFVVRNPCHLGCGVRSHRSGSLSDGRIEGSILRFGFALVSGMLLALPGIVVAVLVELVRIVVSVNGLEARGQVDGLPHDSSTVRVVFFVDVEHRTPGSIVVAVIVLSSSCRLSYGRLWGFRCRDWIWFGCCARLGFCFLAIVVVRKSSRRSRRILSQPFDGIGKAHRNHVVFRRLWCGSGCCSRFCFRFGSGAFCGNVDNLVDAAPLGAATATALFSFGFGAQFSLVKGDAAECRNQNLSARQLCVCAWERRGTVAGSRDRL
mmetsp:Transcript_21819/g.48949  ORF Transcript_21819/g.48949 Transcript_21819/m.48949 type:complete len:401 (+) Transcript_21819:323-1525(+)